MRATASDNAGSGSLGDGFPFAPGEMARLIRAFDWSKTGLGPISEWSQNLKTAVGILLRSPVPIVLLWGPDGIMIYNDAYSVFAGARHPVLLGSKVREGWPEVADFNDHVMKVGLSGGTLSYRDQELTLYRHGRPEQVWMNLDYSAVPDENGRPAGVLAIVVETSERVLAQRALAKAEERLSLALSAAGMVGTFDWRIPTDTSYSGDPARGESGAPLAEYFASVHPEDADRIAEAVNHAVTTGESYNQEYRLLDKDGTVRWVNARGQRVSDEAGNPVRFVGVVVDITDQRDAQERQRLLLQEMVHRVKNVFAVVHGLIGLSARSARTPEEMAEALKGRLDALMQAKDLVRPGLIEGRQARSEQTSLDAIVRTILKPYSDGSGERILASGPHAPVGENATTSLALALHEAATNAAKYGALSQPHGAIRIDWRISGDSLQLDWEEKGGPPIDAPPQAYGFGAVLAKRSIAGQLGGKIDYDWRRSGLKFTLIVPLARLRQ